jgi:transcriptional regulator GlxA family with amidase domain
VLALVHELLRHHGNMTVRQMAGQCAVSARTVERLFRRHLDATPKELAGVVRYQTLWSHVLCQRHWDIQDEVEALGFYDQAHLANTFRRYHGMSLAQGVRLAQPVSRFSKTAGRACAILEAQTAKGEESHGTTLVF